MSDGQRRRAVFAADTTREGLRHTHTVLYRRYGTIVPVRNAHGGSLSCEIEVLARRVLCHGSQHARKDELAFSW